VATADVRHARPRPQLLNDAVERREPTAYQVLAVAGAEEDLGSGKETVVVFVPEQALAAPERLDQAVLVSEERRQDVVRTQQIELALLVGERGRLLWRERVPPARRVYITQPPAAWLPSHSRTIRGSVPLRSASSPGVAGPPSARAP